MPFDTRSSPVCPASGTVGTTGFYRFTDVFFEWHQALPNQDDVSPLKALIAYPALVHPDHPLRKPGVNGIELHLGTFESGEMRLLFSSAQLEYLRYYMHTLGLTKEPIPLPSSEYLIQQKDLVHCSPDVYNEASVLKRAIKTIDKNNKRLKKGMDNILGLRRLIFERVRTLWAAKLGTWCAMDFEAWDRDHTLLTEFGWRLVQWVDDKPVKEHGHLIVKERRQYTQHYVPNNREFYNFGQSIDVDKHEFRDRIRGLIDKHREHGPLFLVFHDHSQDVKYLKSEAIKAIERIDVLPDSPMTGEVYVVDTAELFAALEGDSNNTRSLERVCRHLKIDTKYLHNAGNDAYYTLEAMISMASGDPVDQQREQRWPNRTGDNMPKVEFQEWEEDSDFSDMEGIFGNPVNGANGVQPDADDDEF
ncbi:hypothetical protein OH76DRAFT_1396980 [Lentinus brumalis]|uniref:Gfd2/YDR514C-like C-terminal domain-containing protein n=1 Tax=Lentinus brumalis TaxID=2498619 RepID=A0A371DSW8_9APHY|nr:hypothetical protein OH76DRAFT_1396980 [Polyporus brumalis]